MAGIHHIVSHYITKRRRGQEEALQPMDIIETIPRSELGLLVVLLQAAGCRRIIGYILLVLAKSCLIRKTYSSAHSFSFRICSSSSGVKLKALACRVTTEARGYRDILVSNVEQLADFLRGLSFNHVGNSLATNVTDD